MFQDCFAVTESVELCRLYVSYVRRVNDVITGGERARGIVIQAFEFAINKVGIDVSSHQLWQDYLEFLKSWTPSASWEQNQKTDLIRKVYKKFLVVPTEEIERSWTEYIKWENDINNLAANKFITEKSADFMLARSWYTEYSNLGQKQLKREINPAGATDPNVKRQLKLWLNWIEFEKKNVMEIRDTSVLEKRILYCYKQATISLPFISELWFDYNKYFLLENEEANLSKCIEILLFGLSLNPKSLLLTFQLAELYEKESNFDSTKETFDNLIDAMTVDYKVITSQIEAIQGQTSRTSEIETEDGTPAVEEPVELEKVPFLTLDELSRVAQLKKVEERLGRAITCVYIKKMVSCKRIKGIQESRLIFKIHRNRKNYPEIGFEFFAENAYLEYYSDNKKPALKIFELAFRIFPLNGDFLIVYLNYLIMTNDLDNIRKLLQTSDSNFSKEISSLEEFIGFNESIPSHIKLQKQKEISTLKHFLRKLFKIYILYASNYLSLDVAHSFTTKFEQLFPDHDPIDLFSDRYRIGGVNVIKSFELDEADEEPKEEEHQTKKRKVVVETVNNDVATRSSGKVLNPGLTSLFNQEQEEAEEQSVVGTTIVNLLNALPNASYFGNGKDGVFNNEKLVQLLANLTNVNAKKA